MKLTAVWLELRGELGPMRTRISLENGELYMVQHIDTVRGTQVGFEKWYSKSDIKEQIIDCEDEEQRKQLEYLLPLFELLRETYRGSV